MSNKGTELMDLVNKDKTNNNNNVVSEDKNFEPIMNEPTIFRNVDQNTTQQYIPEPTFQPGLNFNMDDGFDEEQIEKHTAKNAPIVEEKTEQEKEEGAAKLAAKALDVYILGCRGLESLLKISDKKVARLENKGLINTAITVPTKSKGTVTVGYLIKEFNEDVDGELMPDPDFKEKMVTSLTSLFKKWGWGLSSGQSASLDFLEHFGKMLYVGFKLYKQRGDLIEELKEINTNYKKSFQQQAVVVSTPAPVAAQSQPNATPNPQIGTPVSNTTSVATTPSVTILPDDDGLPKNGTGSNRGRKKNINKPN